MPVEPKGWFGLLKDTFTAWRKDKASRLAAALAFYTIFSIGPLLLVVIAVVSFVLRKQADDGTLVSAIAGAVGQQGAQIIQDAVKNASKPGSGIVASVIGVVILLLGASGIFGQLQDALNTVWKVEPESGGLLDTVKQRVGLFLIVLGCGLLLLASLVVNSVLSVLGSFLSSTLPGGAILWQVVNFAVSLGIITVLFAMIYKFIPAT